MSEQLNNEFLKAIKDIEIDFADFGFVPVSFQQKGFAQYVTFQKELTEVQILFGPSDWDVEIIIVRGNEKLEFKDMLQNPLVAEWVEKNRYKQENGRDIRGELKWYVQLLRIVLRLGETGQNVRDNFKI